MAITQGFAGSGGGGGGGGAVTLAGGSVSAGAYVLGSILDGAIVTLGALGDTAVGDATGSLNAHTRQIAKLLGAGITLGAGSAVIGAVTQSGTWNVTVNTALPAGANSIGTVVLGAGAAVVGAVTQSGTWNVTVNAALPVGSNTIGAVTGPGAVALATDRTTAAAPFSHQLSDGVAFYVGAKTGQLPAALVSSRLDVNVGAATTLTANSTLQAGTANAGNTGGITNIISTTLTRPANTTTYTAGREMADTGNNILTLTNISTKSGGSGVIQQVTASCSSNGATKPQLELWLFDTTQSLQASADNNSTPFPLTDPQADTHICVIPLTTSFVGDATAGTGNFIMDTGQINEAFLTNGSANLFMRIIVRNAYTPGANSETWKFKFHVQQDL